MLRALAFFEWNIFYYSKNSLRAPICGREAKLDVYTKMAVPRKMFEKPNESSLRMLLSEYSIPNTWPISAGILDDEPERAKLYVVKNLSQLVKKNDFSFQYHSVRVKWSWRQKSRSCVKV